MQVRWLVAALFGLISLSFAPAAGAREFPIGEPVEREGLQIVPHYLEGIEMSPMPTGMEMGAGAVHLEADVHATRDEKHGYPEDAWVPYLTIRYTLTKEGTRVRKTGTLAPMIARDGPHYANNVRMAGPGRYHLTYSILPPSAKGFVRHVDAATGVPDWWKRITVEWTFDYPVKE